MCLFGIRIHKNRTKRSLYVGEKYERALKSASSTYERALKSASSTYKRALKSASSTYEQTMKSESSTYEMLPGLEPKSNLRDADLYHLLGSESNTEVFIMLIRIFHRKITLSVITFVATYLLGLITFAELCFPNLVIFRCCAESFVTKRNMCSLLSSYVSTDLLLSGGFYLSGFFYCFFCVGFMSLKPDKIYPKTEQLHEVF
jgi:hypothetical protein